VAGPSRLLANVKRDAWFHVGDSERRTVSDRSQQGARMLANLAAPAFLSRLANDRADDQLVAHAGERCRRSGRGSLEQRNDADERSDSSEDGSDPGRVFGASGIGLCRSQERHDAGRHFVLR
jgi:hypothetical protein